MNPKEPLLTPKQVAKIIGISEYSIARYRKLGIGPKYLRFGEKLIRYRKEDVEEWLNRFNDEL
ncbi:MAG: helix-turn-helix domain-containing protein [Alphaproteobacteria bacterium]|nr:helix-turn-helix domain-containing protein [Alphaproteobacteria bacterium]MBQ6110552.1 helix-turn-helix domain-containing protein [Alphaproteobacteria bacterium]